MTAPSLKTVTQVLFEFGVTLDAPQIRPLGAGHIHDTYLVQDPSRSLVLQQLNKAVFPDLDRVAANGDAAFRTLEAARERGTYALDIAPPLRAASGASLAHVAGRAWRVTPYLDGTYTVQQVDTLQRAEAAAEAFGRFCAALVPLDAETLGETIPGFHDFQARMQQLKRAVDRDAFDRRKDAASEIEYCRGLTSLGDAIRETQATVPRRVCHNDTKIDNLLFNETDHRPRAVIDLDTCMPGWWMCDFGDIVRTFCSPELEDTPHHDRVRVRDEIFEAVCRGFTKPLGPHLADGERESLWLGACAITLIVGMRFLTDYLSGDVYFGASREHHNLDRARNQLALHRDLTERESQLRPLLV